MGGIEFLAGDAIWDVLVAADSIREVLTTPFPVTSASKQALAMLLTTPLET